MIEFTNNRIYNEFDENSYPEELVDGMKELKLFWLNIPAKYWWLELSIEEQMQIVRQLAKWSISLTGFRSCLHRTMR